MASLWVDQMRVDPPQMLEDIFPFIINKNKSGIEKRNDKNNFLINSKGKQDFNKLLFLFVDKKILVEHFRSKNDESDFVDNEWVY